MIPAGIILVLGAIYLLRGAIQRQLTVAAVLMGGTVKDSVVAYTLLFFPGVVIHELTHFFMASLLGVRTGDISLFPQPLTGNEARVALGSVKVAKTDFIRESLIGAAPMISGLGILYVLVKLVMVPGLKAWQFGGLIYAVLAVTNTMFLSKEDTRAWVPVVILGLILLAGLGLTGHLEIVTRANWTWLEPTLQTLLFSLMVVGLIDVSLLGLLKAWQWLLEKITHKRVV